MNNLENNFFTKKYVFFHCGLFLQPDEDKYCVGVVTGGGSGHEPFGAGRFHLTSVHDSVFFINFFFVKTINGVCSNIYLRKHHSLS